MELELPYGHAPLRVDVGNRDIEVIRPVALPPPRPLAELLAAAIDAPIGAAALRSMVAPGGRVTVIISDSTRAEPRAAFVSEIRARLPDNIRLTIAIATGTHGPCGLAGLDIDPRDATIIDHDGHRPDDLVELGTTPHGTPVRVHRCVVEADLVIATGCIRPHYFAGFGAGSKAIFPGLGEATAIRINHRLKTEPGARAGIVDGNPCRADLEAAARLVPTPTFLINGVCGPDNAIHAVVAGDLFTAFRAGVDLARPWFTVRAPRAPLVLASDALPVSASLYQAAKIAAAVAPLVEPGGTLAIVAECANGIESIHTVNEAIFRIGVLPRLPPSCRLVLVSSLAPNTVAKTLCEHVPSVESLLETNLGRVVAIPRASQLICESA